MSELEETIKAIIIMFIIIFILSFIAGKIGIHGTRSYTPYGDAECGYSDCY